MCARSSKASFSFSQFGRKVTNQKQCEKKKKKFSQSRQSWTHSDIPAYVCVRVRRKDRAARWQNRYGRGSRSGSKRASYLIYLITIGIYGKAWSLTDFKWNNAMYLGLGKDLGKRKCLLQYDPAAGKLWCHWSPPPPPKPQVGCLVGIA